MAGERVPAGGLVGLDAGVARTWMGPGMMVDSAGGVGSAAAALVLGWPG